MRVFLNEQCKEIEENKRMGKTRDLFKKIGDIKGAFHPKMGVTDSMGMNLGRLQEMLRDREV